jgi:hypothetical protein
VSEPGTALCNVSALTSSQEGDPPLSGRRTQDLRIYLRVVAQIIRFRVEHSLSEAQADPFC